MKYTDAKSRGVRLRTSNTTASRPSHRPPRELTGWRASTAAQTAQTHTPLSTGAQAEVADFSGAGFKGSAKPAK